MPRSSVAGGAGRLRFSVTAARAPRLSLFELRDGMIDRGQLVELVAPDMHAVPVPRINRTSTPFRLKTQRRDSPRPAFADGRSLAESGEKCVAGQQQRGRPRRERREQHCSGECKKVGVAHESCHTALPVPTQCGTFAEAIIPATSAGEIPAGQHEHRQGAKASGGFATGLREASRASRDSLLETVDFPETQAFHGPGSNKRQTGHQENRSDATLQRFANLVPRRPLDVAGCGLRVRRRESSESSSSATAPPSVVFAGRPTRPARTWKT